MPMECAAILMDYSADLIEIDSTQPDGILWR